MIGLDTNVVLRLLLDDDPAQSPRARALVAAHGTVPGSLRLCDTVLLETLWTLTHGYRFSRQALAHMFGGLLAEPAFAVADRERLAEVLRRYGASKADIGDAFIAVDNERAGCTWTATFDADATGVPGMKLMP
jgi:predicted nucleic-acid-binding protein